MKSWCWREVTKSHIQQCNGKCRNKTVSPRSLAMFTDQFSNWTMNRRKVTSEKQRSNFNLSQPHHNYWSIQNHKQHNFFFIWLVVHFRAKVLPWELINPCIKHKLICQSQKLLGKNPNHQNTDAYKKSRG